MKVLTSLHPARQADCPNNMYETFHSYMIEVFIMVEDRNDLKTIDKTQIGNKGK